MRIRISKRRFIDRVYEMLKKNIVRGQQPQFWREIFFCNGIAESPPAERYKYGATVNLPETGDYIDVVGID
jgi:hypothetical protein